MLPRSVCSDVLHDDWGNGTWLEYAAHPLDALAPDSRLEENKEIMKGFVDHGVENQYAIPLS
jgi:hypothetical protein